MKMELLDLPNEMLQKIAGCLPAKSLCLLGGACRVLNNIANVDALWQSLCQQEFKIFKKDGWDITFKQIYTKILIPLPVLGLRRCALSPFGGLVHITWGEGEIRISRLTEGTAVDDPLVPKPLFSIRWNSKEEAVEVKCLQRKSELAPAKIVQNGTYAVFKCSDKYCYKSHQSLKMFQGQSEENFPIGFDDHKNVFGKLNFNTGFSCPLLPLRTSLDNSRCPVSPGLFKGHYGDHGIEILQAGMSQEDPNCFEVLKLTGDSNVPAGNVTVKVCLDRPVLLQKEDQESIDHLLELDNDRPEESYERLRESNDGNPDLRQPFVIPHDCSERGMPEYAKYKSCLARYCGLGRIAGTFYTNPQHCKLHFVKFDDDTFGILWTELYWFSIFHREKQHFPICTS